MTGNIDSVKFCKFLEFSYTKTSKVITKFLRNIYGFVSFEINKAPIIGFGPT